MDTISHLMRLAHLEGMLDTRCLFHGPTVVDHRYEPRTIHFHLMLEGTGSIELEDRTLNLISGDVVLLTRGQAHSVHTGLGAESAISRTDGTAFTTARAGDGGNIVDLFCGHYAYGPGAGDILFQSLPDVIHVNLDEKPGDQVRALTWLIRGEADNEGPGSAVVLSSICDALLTIVLRQAPAQQSHGQILWTAIDDERMQSVVDAIIHQPDYPWTISELAQRVTMSRATFIRHFTRTTGMNVGDFLTQVRMMTAAQLLTNTDMPIAEVAAAVGFGSESSFGRAFRLATTTAPGRFRRDATLTRTAPALDARAFAVYHDQRMGRPPVTATRAPEM
jgi:AraC family transcriptional activator of mtrCDE